ncbi:MAG TPA: glutathione S-transferase family protein [Polyangiaceae bacterium]|nr:glutathione S-transferase family protein [Polyangiaceae bacterium]
MIQLSVLPWVPPFAQGLVRELRVRWALEEAGLRYEQRPIDQQEQQSPRYRARQPFGQVPTYEEQGLVLFESGAIVLHIAEGAPSLMPSTPDDRARTKSWMFAALNSVEPCIQNLAELDHFHADKEWAKLRRPELIEVVQARLATLSGWLQGREYLESQFTAADLLMTSVLRILRYTELVLEVPTLEAYRLRCEARPGFQKAMADHMALFGSVNDVVRC